MSPQQSLTDCPNKALIPFIHYKQVLNHWASSWNKNIVPQSRLYKPK